MMMMMNSTKLMQKDKELHQLFRARLPIASLPKDFAERLTKAVLDEVSNLRQSVLSSSQRSDHYRDNLGELQVAGCRLQVTDNRELWNLQPATCNL
jgi:hypothetical protein